MNLNELIDSEGLEVVSDKTNISITNLKKLVDLDFEGLNRVKALGFLSILRREYGVELDTIEDSIKDYFIEHNADNSEPVLVSVDNSNEEKSFNFLKWIIIFAILGTIYYLYDSGKLSKFVNDRKDNKDINLTDIEDLESNISEESVKNSIVIKKDANETNIEINTTISDSTKDAKDINDTTKDTNETTSKIVVEVPKDKSGKEGNKTIVVSEDAGVIQPPQPSEIIDADSTMVQEDENVDTTTQPITNVTINPTRGNLWYGFINIETGKKKDFMRAVSTPFDLMGGKWILITGHGFLDIVSDVKSLSIADRKRHYFYIDDKDIVEISREEFLKLNHGRIW